MLQIPHSADDLKTAVDAQLAWTGNEDAGFYARAGTTLYTIESVGAHLSRPYEVRTVDLGGGGDPGGHPRRAVRQAQNPAAILSGHFRSAGF